MSEFPNNILEIKKKVESASLELGSGARFWTYISPQNDTEVCLTRWQVTLQQGNWQDSISSDNPQKILQTPGLSGVFQVTVITSGKSFPNKKIMPIPDSKPNIGCNSNCHAMIGIVANENCTDAN